MTNISHVLADMTPSAPPVPPVEPPAEPRPKPAPTKLPKAALEEVAKARQEGRSFFTLTAPLLISGACPNCNGARWVGVEVVLSGPTLTPGLRNPPGRTYTYLNERDHMAPGWYLVERHNYDCPLCADPRERIPYLMEQSGLVENEKAWRVDYLVGRPGKEQALDAARAILAEVPCPKGLAIFWGPFGTGKSGTMKAIVASCILAGVSARYALATDILSEIRSTFARDADVTEEDLAHLYDHYQVLALDEIEKISDTMWATSKLMSVIEHRYNRRFERATLLGTNENPAMMPPGFGYLESRMKDGQRVFVTGEDMRGKG